MLQVSELYTYPIKSLAGVRLNEAVVTDRGIQHDRRWMLIDGNNRFISQREHAIMALLTINIKPDCLTVSYLPENTSVDIPLIPRKQALVQVTVWDDTCKAQLVCDDADNWFTGILGINCRLVYMPDDAYRPTDPEYTPGSHITSFSDAYPFLLIGQSSLDELNSRLIHKVKINRFRPNIVFTGGEPFCEDQLDSFTINGVSFNGVKLCARCNVIMIDQGDASIGKEPTKTLASYRRKNNKIYFGQNLIHNGPGIIRVNDELTVGSLHTSSRFFIHETAV